MKWIEITPYDKKCTKKIHNFGLLACQAAYIIYINKDL